MRRLLVLTAVLLVAPGVVAGEATAASECRGLDVCISVPGPWVAVPPSSGEATVVHYQLTCPRRNVVGGLDAVLSDRRLDVKFLGSLGSPVNPGITTGRSVVFVATYARARWGTFRPFIGCIPRSGGGGRQSTSYTPFATDVEAARPTPPVRRVRTLRLRAGGPRSLVATCAPGERLVASSHAVGFRRTHPPSASILGGVQVERIVSAGRVEVTATRGSAVPRGLRVDVQVHVLCARGAA